MERDAASSLRFAASGSRPLPRSTRPDRRRDFEERALAAALDHQALNEAAASLYRERSDRRPGSFTPRAWSTPTTSRRSFPCTGMKRGCREHATRSAAQRALAAYERGEINVLINAHAVAEGWNSPAQRCACTSLRLRRGACTSTHRPHLASTRGRRPASSSTSSRRVQRIGARRLAPRTTGLRFYARARLTPAPDSASNDADAASSPGSAARPGHARRRATAGLIEREWQRSSRGAWTTTSTFWATIAGGDPVSTSVANSRRSSPRVARRGRARAVPVDVCRRNQIASAHDGAHGSGCHTDRSSRLDDLVTLVTQARRRTRIARPESDPPARDRRGKAARARSDPRALDVAARTATRKAQIGASRLRSPRRSVSSERRDPAATAMRRASTASSRWPPRCRGRWVRRCCASARRLRAAREQRARRRPQESWNDCR